MNRVKRKRRPVGSDPSQKWISTRLRLLPSEHKLLIAAARRRGLSFTAFVSYVCVAAAAKVLASPVDPILGIDVKVDQDGFEATKTP